MRRATPSDRPVIEAALRERLVTSMFPLSNLAQHGMDGAHDRSMSFWIADRTDGPPDIIAKTREGMVMPSCVGTPWSEAAAAMAGIEVIGVIGATPQARPLIRALALDGVATDLNADDPQFTLDLRDLVVPDGEGQLIRLAAADRHLMTSWRRDFLCEAMSMDHAKAGAQAEADIEKHLATDAYRVLIGPDGPCAVTGFNAEFETMVQIGGVYTPPPLRGRGYARRAVALHLAEARESGARSATLFAFGEDAARAYRAIGFQWVGEWTLFLTAERERIGG
jgi:GNAT superfamily N-acetyltransferase